MSPPGPPPSYPSVDSQPDFPKLEEDVLAFWAEDDTFRASIERRQGRHSRRLKPADRVGRLGRVHFFPMLFVGTCHCLMPMRDDVNWRLFCSLRVWNARPFMRAKATARRCVAQTG